MFIDTELTFISFLQLFCGFLDKHASLKEITKREEKEKFKV